VAPLPRAAVLDDYSASVARLACWDRLDGLAEVDVFTDHCGDDDTLVARLAGYEIVVPIRERTILSRPVLQALPELRLVALTGRSIGQVDLAAASAHGIVVTETAGSGASAPELTIALILALARHIPHHDSGMRRGGWESRVGQELSGKSLGILGLGRVGSRVARVGAALGMTVLAAGLTLTDERAELAGATRVEIEQLFTHSDVVTVHLRLGASTRGIVGPALFERMKPSALFVNTARADLVDQHALVDALRDRRIAGAALDVYATEPLPPDDPLRQLDNVVLSPHVGYVTSEAFELFFDGAAEQIEMFVTGRTPSRIVNVAGATKQPAAG
jgi:phosphoglycerate dehydrogenase-like enzyme